VNTVMNIRDP